jgi:hypothetical protein
MHLLSEYALASIVSEHTLRAGPSEVIRQSDPRRRAVCTLVINGLD